MPRTIALGFIVEFEFNPDFWMFSIFSEDGHLYIHSGPISIVLFGTAADDSDHGA